MGTKRSGAARYRALIVAALAALCVALGAAGSASAALTLPSTNTTGLVGSVQQTLTGVQASIATAQAAGTALQANATSFAATIQAIAASAPDDPQAAVAALEAAANAEAGALESQSLATALKLASQLVAPSCSVIGALTAATPVGANIDYDPLGPLGLTLATTDRSVSDTLLKFYTDQFTTLLTPLALPPALAPAQPYVTLAQALLGLLKVNWHTTYYPPNGGTPVVRDTPALLNVPMLLDVDGSTGPDVCGRMTLDLTTGMIGQQIAKLPTARATLPLDIQSQFLSGVIAPGYETRTTEAPISFATALGLNGTPVDTELTRPGATFMQTHNLTSALQFRYASTGAPRTAAYHFASTRAGGSAGNGTQLNYSSPNSATRFAYSLNLGSLSLGVATSPAPASFEWCTSAKGFCSNEPASQASTEKSSLHLLASEPVTVDQTSAAGATACPSFATLGDAHLTGSRLFLGVDTTVNPGHAWIDTDGTAVSGCLATASTTGSLPAGFQAQDRLVTWGGSGSPAPATAKSGTISCPAGTALTGGSLGIAFGLSRYLCAFPPLNTVAPAISGDAYQASTLTANKGTWTPGAPNTPAFTYQWLRCDAAGNACAPIAGETGTAYTATSGDLGHALRASVTATNLDGTATQTTAPTAAVTLAPAP